MSEAKLSKESRSVSGRWVALAWAATILFSWWGIGSYLGILAEGNDRSLIPRGPLVPPALAVVVSLVLTVIWARGLGRDAAAPAHGLGRRRFLVGSATTLGGLALHAGVEDHEAQRHLPLQLVRHPGHRAFRDVRVQAQHLLHGAG